ncbi:hypothetical protein TRFO_02712 [Tritrichomonas foetus]|uniref:Potential DNA-binding domain-containing protein n=1 Tax=Tritrichomonas foetus TaxID=1144522 RepID=A0A1J4KZZ9_9EUKA|nr:hypothetical protein TRFO_02712 [Tritrichomonas foetus]|eukprot:OHT16448.1 hypothetical protein TRFO_02712 [Tritrichomonas foetus]
MERRGDQRTSKLECAITKLGGSISQDRKNRYNLSDSPPENSLIKINRIIGPKQETSHFVNKFPFQNDAFILDQKEMIQWQIDRISKSLQHIEKLKDQMDDIVTANAFSTINSSHFDKRRQCFYNIFTSILSSPREAAMQQLDILISYKKLILNRYYKEKNIVLADPEKCCRYRGCPLLAVHGSDFCGWHILLDANQQIYAKCDVCGWPRLKTRDSQCNGHDTVV